MRRVVVTGIGILGPLGCGMETTWRRLVAVGGASAVSPIYAFGLFWHTDEIDWFPGRGKRDRSAPEPFSDPRWDVHARTAVRRD
jgi:3-oxoacyl-(acyl-carrier-protein) synthase